MAREERKTRALVVTSDGREGEVFFWYVGTETGDARVGGCSCADSGRKNTAGEAGNRMA